MFVWKHLTQKGVIEVRHDVCGKRQTANNRQQRVIMKHENLRFLTCLTLLRTYSIYLGNRQEMSLNKSNLSLFWQEGNFILPFAVNVMLHLSNISKMRSPIHVLSLCQRFLISHFQVLSDVVFFAISAGVISTDSEFDAITFALNYTAPFSNITINLRTFNATEPANSVCKQGKILILSNQELML